MSLIHLPTLQRNANRALIAGQLAPIREYFRKYAIKSAKPVSDATLKRFSLIAALYEHIEIVNYLFNEIGRKPWVQELEIHLIQQSVIKRKFSVIKYLVEDRGFNVDANGALQVISFVYNVLDRDEIFNELKNYFIIILFGFDIEKMSLDDRESEKSSVLEKCREIGSNSEEFSIIRNLRNLLFSLFKKYSVNEADRSNYLFDFLVNKANRGMLALEYQAVGNDISIFCQQRLWPQICKKIKPDIQKEEKFEKHRQI